MSLSKMGASAASSLKLLQQFQIFIQSSHSFLSTDIQRVWSEGSSPENMGLFQNFAKTNRQF